MNQALSIFSVLFVVVLFLVLGMFPPVQQDYCHSEPDYRIDYGTYMHFHVTGADRFTVRIEDEAGNLLFEKTRYQPECHGSEIVWIGLPHHCNSTFTTIIQAPNGIEFTDVWLPYGNN